MSVDELIAEIENEDSKHAIAIILRERVPQMLQEAFTGGWDEAVERYDMRCTCVDCCKAESAKRYGGKA